MDETIATPNAAPRPRRRFRLLAGLRENPVIVREMRARMRGNRAFILLSIYLLIMAFILSMVYVAFLESYQNSYYSNRSLIESRRQLGQLIFQFVIGIELFAVCVFTPALTSSSITSEREQQTLELVKTTLLSARSLVNGKFFSGFLFVLLMLLTTLPLQSLAFLFGGVAPEELIINALTLICTAASFCAVGILCSSLFKTTRMANGIAYAAPLIYVLLIPAFVLFLVALSESPWSSSQYNQGQQTFFAILLWASIAFNPIATIITSETLMVSEHAVWVYQLDLAGSNYIYVPSPWIPYCILAVLVTVVLLAFSARLVRRMESG